MLEYQSNPPPVVLMRRRSFIWYEMQLLTLSFKHLFSHQRYNDFIEWRTDMPFARYDQKVDGFRNLTKPFYQSRSNFINTRDEVLEALLNRQKASWEPVVNASLQARVQIEEKRAKADQIANELALGRISHTIFDVRSLFNKLQTNKIYLTHTAKLCALNPACCSNPQLCAPIQLRQQF